MSASTPHRVAHDLAAIFDRPPFRVSSSFRLVEGVVHAIDGEICAQRLSSHARDTALTGTRGPLSTTHRNRISTVCPSVVHTVRVFYYVMRDAMMVHL